MEQKQHAGVLRGRKPRDAQGEFVASTGRSQDHRVSQVSKATASSQHTLQVTDTAAFFHHCDISHFTSRRTRRVRREYKGESKTLEFRSTEFRSFTYLRGQSYCQLRNSLLVTLAKSHISHYGVGV